MKMEKMNLESYANLKNLLISKNDELKVIFAKHNALVEELKAENERLRSSSFMTAVPSEQYERVIKAGDALLGNYYATLSNISDFEQLPSVARWFAAKEGRDAK